MTETNETQKNAITVMVVDDEVHLRDLLKRKFERRGFTVQVAGGGQEAFELLKKHPEVEVVITDIRMPEGNGIELLDNVKKHLGDNAPAMLCMSAFSDLTLDDAYHKGADALFPKPIDMDALCSAVQHFCQSRRSRLKHVA